MSDNFHEGEIPASEEVREEEHLRAEAKLSTGRRLVDAWQERRQPDEAAVAEARQKKFDSLAPERGDRVMQVNEQLNTLETAQGPEMDWLREKRANDLLDAFNTEEPLPPTVRERLIKDAERMLEVIDKLNVNFEAVLAIARNEMWEDAEGGSSAEVDPFTGLHTKEALMARIARALITSENSSDILQRLKIKAGDMNNFKQANDILKHSGFNTFLRETLANNFIALSQYLGNQEYRGKPDNVRIEELFDMKKKGPEGENNPFHQMLENAKQMGIRIDMYRAQPGGDEIYFAYEFTGDLSKIKEAEELADKLVEYVFSQCVLGKHNSETELKLFREMAENAPKAFAIPTPPEDAPAHEKRHAQFWQQFSEHVSSNIKASGIANAIVEDPNCVLRMSATTSKARSIEEVKNCFTYGKDFIDNLLVTKEGTVRTDVGLVDEYGRPDPQKIAAYDERTINNVANRIEARGFSAIEDIGPMLDRAASDQVSGLGLELTMDEADELKAQDKIELVYQLFTGDMRNSSLAKLGFNGRQIRAEVAYSVGSLRAADRLKKELAETVDRQRLWDRTYEDQVALFSDNKTQQSLIGDIDRIRQESDNHSNFIRNMRTFIQREPFIKFYFDTLITIDDFADVAPAIRPPLPQGLGIEDIRLIMSNGLLPDQQVYR